MHHKHVFHTPFFFFFLTHEIRFHSGRNVAVWQPVQVALDETHEIKKGVSVCVELQQTC